MCLIRPSLAAAAVAIAAVLAGPSQLAAQVPLPCAACVSVTIGPAMILRGPAGDENDAPFVALKLPDGRLRGFVSNTTTYAVDGASITDMGGTRRPVLRPGAKGTASDCGSWLTGLSREGATLWGLLHWEATCNYEKGETHKSMGIATSTHDGLTWRILGTIIESGDKPSAGKLTGEGDCTMADGHDGYLYVYCLRPRDWKITAMRAPKTNPIPGQWMKWDGVGWDVPALGGFAAPLAGFPGHSAAWWVPQNLMLLLAVEASLKLSLSSDKVRFAQVPEPLIPYDADEWNRPAPTPLYAYPSLVAPNGGNDVGDESFLSYAYVPPDAGFTERYLVAHEMRMTMQEQPVSPQVKLALSRYVTPGGENWTTSGVPAIAGERPRFTFEATLGYVMTAAPTSTSILLEECVSASAGRFLSDRTCSSDLARRLRSAGYVYSEEQPGTRALYNCTRADSRFFASTDEACEQRGRPDRRLGFLIAP